MLVQYPVRPEDDFSGCALNRRDPASEGRGRNRITSDVLPDRIGFVVMGRTRSIDRARLRSLAVRCGRRRERNRETSPNNRTCDVEWRSPPAGEAGAFEDEVAIRRRAADGRIWHLERTASHHDAAIEGMSKGWQPAFRCCHGHAQVGSLHPEPPEYDFRRERRNASESDAWPGAIACAASPIFDTRSTL